MRRDDKDLSLAKRIRINDVDPRLRGGERRLGKTNPHLFDYPYILKCGFGLEQVSRRLIGPRPGMVRFRCVSASGKYSAQES